MEGEGEGAALIELPPGFRFHPTDDELVNDYLCRKCASRSIAVPIIKDIHLYNFDPWQLPEMGGGGGEKEWYFFSPRDRKYPNGSRPNRAAGTGYWKATGADKPIGKPKPVGIKKALVFYAGKAPKGVKTNWIMHEYRLANVDRSAAAAAAAASNNCTSTTTHNNNSNLRLDDWVLCRIYNKKGKIEKYNNIEEKASSMIDENETKKKKKMYGQDNDDDLIRNEDQHQLWTEDTSDSVPRFQTDSSGSDHVDMMRCEKEVQSEPKWSHDLDLGPDPHAHPITALDFQLKNFMDNRAVNDMMLGLDDPFAPQLVPYQINQFEDEDVFTYLPKSF